MGAFRTLYLSVFFACVLTACGGSGGGSSPAPLPVQGMNTATTAPQTPSPAPTASPIPSSTSLSVGQSGGSATVASGGVSVAIAFPASSGAATLQVFAGTSLPAGLPALQSVLRAPKSATAVMYIQITATKSASLNAMPTFTASTGINGVAVQLPSSTSWNYTSYAAGSSGAFIAPGGFLLSAGQSYYFALFTGVPASPSPSPSPSPTPTAAPISGGGSAPTLAPIPTVVVGGRIYGWAPYAVANAFQFGVQSGFNGAGVTVAIVGSSPPSTADLAAFLAQFGIAGGAYSVRNVDGGPITTNDFEGTLDVETVAGLAPGANIVYYATPDLSTGHIIDAYNAIASDNVASVVSLSFGGCESAASSNFLSSQDAIFAQAAARGIAYLVSAGDSGSRCYAGPGTTLPHGVDEPASDPNVIAVGGTQATSSTCALDGIGRAQAWNDFCAAGNQQEATGGGVSTFFALPSYQQGRGASSSFRNVPDIALPAVAAGIYFRGAWTSIGGTSWSAPEGAALVAEIYQYCRTPIANPASLFYSAAFTRGQFGSAFIDVTAGNNQFASDANFFAASGGFDNVSGIGIPLGMPIAQTLCPNRVLTGAARAARDAVVLQPTGRAEATLVRNVPSLRGIQDLGRRVGSSQTRIVLVLRNTVTIAGDEQSVVNALSAAGFSITGRFANHLVVDAEAPAATVASFFQTELHDFAQGGQDARYANVSPAVVPAALAPFVQGVITDNLILTAATPHRLSLGMRIQR